MDWPVIGAVAGLATLTGAVTVGGWALLQSAPAPVNKVKTPLLLAETRPAPQPSTAPYALASAPAAAGLPTLTAVSPPPSPLPRLAEPALAPMALRPATGPGPLPYKPMLLMPERRLSPPQKQSAPAPARKPAAPIVDERYAHVLTPEKISDLRRMLHLLSEQRPNWPPVERMLREIGRVQMSHLRRGESPEVDSGLMMQLYSAAQPLLGSLNPNQKERIRSLARSLGYPSVASML